MKKRIAIVLGVLVLGAVGFVVADRLLGAHRLEAWIGSVVVGVANSYLVPEISYDEIAYTAPGRVDLGGVAFTAPDGTRIIEIASFSLSLAEIPRPGKPLLVERVEIRDGTVNLIQDPETGEIKGLIPLVKPGPSDEFKVETGGGKTREFRLSESLQLREIVLDNIDLRFDDGSGTPLILDDITMASAIAPEVINGQEGWYSLDITMDRGDALSMSVPGHVNLDTLVARVSEGTFRAQLNDETITSLPSALQSLLAEYDASGLLELRFNGMMPLKDPNAGLVAVNLTLEDFHLTQGDYVFPIDSLIVQAGLAEGALSVSRLSADTIGGTVSAEAQVPLSGEPATAGWTIDALDLAQLMSAQVEDNQRKLAGVLSSSGTFEARIDALPDSIDGAGTMQVRKGRLMRIPGLAELASVMNVITTGEGKPNHRVDVEFEFAPQGVEITKSEILTGFLAARATGVIAYDTTMDLAVNAGPLERLQSALGAFGDVFGKLTDQIMTYNVRGALGNPTVTASVGKRGSPNATDTADDTSTDDTPDDEGGA